MFITSMIVGGCIGSTVTFSSSPGFYVGQEGPMFYIGAVIGSGVSQVRAAARQRRAALLWFHTAN